jgi:hypothetical protein
VVKRKAELSDYLAGLEPKFQKTVQWWMETDKVDRSNPLMSVAELYRREYLASLPGPKGKKAPSLVDRELATIARTILRLRDQLGTGISREARRRLKDRLKNTHLSGWLEPINMAMAEAMNPYFSPFNGRLSELQDLADNIQGMMGGGRKKPHHYWLIQWTVTRLRAGKKPRGHVLPIVQCIHQWASGGEAVSDDFGAEYLDTFWPPRKGTK